MDGGLMDKFVQNSALSIQHCDPKLVMGYFDGNTVTAYTMSDNFHSSNIDPSLPGAISLVTGQTHGATPRNISKIVANGLDRRHRFDLRRLFCGTRQNHIHDRKEHRKLDE